MVTGGTVIIVRTTGTVIIARITGTAIIARTTGTAITARTATTAAGRASPSALAAADIAAGKRQSPQRCGLFSFGRIAKSGPDTAFPNTKIPDAPVQSGAMMPLGLVAYAGAWVFHF